MLGICSFGPKCTTAVTKFTSLNGKGNSVKVKFFARNENYVISSIIFKNAYVMANVELGLELSQLNSSPKLSTWGLMLSQVKNSSLE